MEYSKQNYSSLAYSQWSSSQAQTMKLEGEIGVKKLESVSLITRRNLWQ